MSDVRIDSEGDAWERADGGWRCYDYPDAWAPSLEVLDDVFGPLTDPYEED